MNNANAIVNTKNFSKVLFIKFNTIIYPYTFNSSIKKKIFLILLYQEINLLKDFTFRFKDENLPKKENSYPVLKENTYYHQEIHR